MAVRKGSGTPLNARVHGDLKQNLKQAADDEDHSLSHFSELLLRWAFNQYEKVGSWKELKKRSVNK